MRNEAQPVQGTPAWSKELVLHLLLSSLSIHLYAVAPYLAQLYRDDIHQKIQHPADIVGHQCAPPLLIQKSGKNYFIPGNLDDLVLYNSCVAACAGAILRSLAIDTTKDVGPPFATDTFGGLIGSQNSMRSAWRSLTAMVRQRLKTGHTVVTTDIASCAGSINLDRLHHLLLQTPADRAAVDQLHKMHQFWQQSGCHGIPLTGGFCLLLKLYLAEVDAQLLRHGLDFIRLQDDFRIFCLSSDDAVMATRVLKKALSGCYMRLNQMKTRLLKPGARASWFVRCQAIKHVFSGGVGLPLLCEMLQFDLLRPMALLLLRRFYGHRCRPIDIMNSEQ
jgi:hypothetical protein